MKNVIEINKFPIQPTFISNLNPEIYSPEIEDDLNNNGVFNSDIIEGWLAIIAKEGLIEHPTALFEFIPKLLVTKNALVKNRIVKHIDPFIKNKIKGKVLIRTDVYEHVDLKPSCYLFRKIIDESRLPNCEGCQHSDSRVGLLSIEKLTKGNIKSQIAIELQSYNNKYNSDMKVLEFKDREYLCYTCKYSGFHEYMFPIYFENKIIGCLMTGQYIPDTLTARMAYINYTTHLKNEGITLNKTQLSKFNTVLKDQFKVEKNKKEKKINKSVNSAKENVDIFFKKIIDHLIKFEDNYCKRVALHRQRFILNKFSLIKKSFYERNKNLNKQMIDAGDPSIIGELSENIALAFKDIIELFENKNGFIRLFGVKEFTTPKKLVLLAASDRENSQSVDDYWYDTNMIPEEIKKNREQVTSIELPKILNGLMYKDRKIEEITGNHIVRYYPTLASNLSFIIWKKYDTKINFITEHNDGHHTIYGDGMLDLYAHFVATYAYIWGNMNEKNLENSVRIAGHEANQLIPVIQDTIRREINTLDKLYSNISNNLLHKKIDDIYKHLELLQFVMSRPTFIIKQSDLNQTTTDLDEILLNIRNVYRDIMDHKKIGMSIFRQENEHTKLEADSKFLVHLLHNLIDNAIKYTIRGSVIEITRKKSNSELILHIVSYGPKIKDGKAIYEIYKREMDNSDGLGIGLYLSKMIAEAHGWLLSHNSSGGICDFHFGCLSNFKKLKDSIGNSLSADKYAQLAIAYDKLMLENQKFSFVATSSSKNFKFIPGLHEFLADFDHPTYKNDFFIKIPIKKEQNL